MPASTPSWSGFPAPAQSANIETTELLACICSADGGHGSAPIIHAHTVGLIPGYFSGVGDLFSALVLAHFSVPSAGPASGFRQLDGHGQTPLSRATSAALAKTHNVLARTQAYFEGLPEDERTASDEEKDRANPERRVARMRARELKLVQSQDIIRDEELGKEGMVLWKDFGGLA
jgi:pyridoxine kinase